MTLDSLAAPRRVKNAGVPTALNGGDPSQHAMLVHSVDQEDITDVREREINS